MKPRREKKAKYPALDPGLRESIFRCSARRPELLGYALAVARRHQGINPEQQAQQLGLDLDGLARLSLCKVPRPDHLVEDLAAVSEHSGLDQSVLLDLLSLFRGSDAEGQEAAVEAMRIGSGAMDVVLVLAELRREKK